MKRLVLGTLRMLGVFALCRFLHRRQLLVLTYHGVLSCGADSDDYLDRNCVDASAFRQQMRHLSERYHPLSLPQIEDALCNKRPFPKYSVAVTFDDGFRNNYTVAYPILREYGVPGAIFLTTGFIGSSNRMLWTEDARRAIYRTDRPEVSLQLGERFLSYPTTNATERERASREIVEALKSVSDEQRRQSLESLRQTLGSPRIEKNHAERYDFMGWDEVTEMARNEIEFGSHTVNHPILSTLNDEDVFEEVTRSKSEIQKVLRKDCRFFGYPNGARGDFTDRDKALLERAGYTCAFTQLDGFNSRATDRFELRRMNVGKGHDFLSFLAMTTGVLALLKRAAGR